MTPRQVFGFPFKLIIRIALLPSILLVGFLTAIFLSVKENSWNIFIDFGKLLWDYVMMGDLKENE